VAEAGYGSCSIGTRPSYGRSRGERSKTTFGDHQGAVVVYVQELIFNVNDDEYIAQHGRHPSASATAANVGS
jgi:hypothetical protein